MKFARRNARGGAPEPRGLDGCCGAAPPSRAVAAARGRVALAEIKQTIADQPSYGYRRVHALIRRVSPGTTRAAGGTRAPPHSESQL
jgi:hypothetical protein